MKLEQPLNTYFYSQRDLEYDPVLYQRDRGELDWDQRSIATTAVFSDSHLSPSKSQYSNSAINLNAYDTYLARGPGSGQGHEIELASMDTMQQPLLHPNMGYHQQGFASEQSLTPSLPPSLYQTYNGSSRDVPLHRPQDRSYSPTPAYVSTDNLNPNPSSPSSSYAATPVSQISPSSYFNGPPPQQHQRQTSGNMLASPYSATTPTQNQYPPQQHGRQNSGNLLAQGRQSPGPYQAYPSQQQPQHGRQSSGNMLGQGRQSPGPYQAYPSQQQSPQHGRQMSGNMLATTRIPSPGPHQVYSPQTPSGQPQYQQQWQGGDPNNQAGRGSHRGY